ncbi:hypothetical protein O0L34_g14986 [Tuta absoluta]|nr:hypothetical protein O0L34_g14986 [Tuta absoluta]
MNSAVFLLAFAVLWEICSAIRCYKCHPDTTATNVEHCLEFDHSEKFIVDCPHSTLCMKRVVELSIFREISNTTERMCAPQYMSDYQAKDEHGKWQQHGKVFEVHEEGCKEETVENGKATKTTNCFCRGDLCNSAVVTRGGLTSMFILILWMLL